MNKEFKDIGDEQTKDLARMYYVPAQYPNLRCSVVRQLSCEFEGGQFVITSDIRQLNIPVFHVNSSHMRLMTGFCPIFMLPRDICAVSHDY